MTRNHAFKRTWFSATDLNLFECEVCGRRVASVDDYWPTDVELQKVEDCDATLVRSIMES